MNNGDLMIDNKFIKYSNILREADIIVVYNRRSWLHRLIYGVTGYKAGHVLIYLFSDLIAEAQINGVRVKNLKKYKKTKYDLYIFRYKMVDVDKSSAIIASSLKCCGERYAVLQLIAILFKYLFRLKKIKDVSRKAMICSEFVARAYKDAGVSLFPNKNTAEVVPSDFIHNALLDNVFMHKS